MKGEVTFPSGDLTLAGTLVVPDGARAIVVFAHGSGPIDRDENSATARLDIFNSLSDALAEAGVASLRYDKRGIGASGGDFATAGQGALCADLRAAVHFARGKLDAPLFLCGHSEGTYLAARIAPKVAPAGLILICPYLQRGDAILVEQVARVDRMIEALPGIKGWLTRRFYDLRGWPSTQQKRFIGRLLKTDAPSLRHAGRDVPVIWLRDFARNDPADAHGGHAVPTLILPAQHDAQCDPGDGERIAALGPDRTVIHLDGLSHILRKTDRADIADYGRQIEGPIDPGVARHIHGWLEGRLA